MTLTRSYKTQRQTLYRDGQKSVSYVGCVNSPQRQEAGLRNLGHTFLAISVYCDNLLTVTISWLWHILFSTIDVWNCNFYCETLGYYDIRLLWPFYIYPNIVTITGKDCTVCPQILFYLTPPPPFFCERHIRKPLSVIPMGQCLMVPKKR